ncbi:MAG: hypothetical protein KZQ93_15825 [Candidatus Thiodiazotropha sp. (ex Monitilora ramsayi)]|nr:hypothetical protein [Candidatus Thiodiazotropha sp. (ex Monitilora ramsayi)]
MTDPFEKHNRALIKKRGKIRPIKIGNEIFEPWCILGQQREQREVGNVKTMVVTWTLDIPQSELVRFGEICIKSNTCLEADGMHFTVVSVDADIKGMNHYDLRRDS